MQGDSISQTSQEPHAAPIGCMPNATGHPSHSTRLRRCWPSTRTGTRVLASLILIHVGLLAWMAYRDSPTWDEVGHFAAGVSHWQSGVFCLYTVNPPLVRLVACAPVVLLMHPAVDLGPYAYLADSQIRSEFLHGPSFLLCGHISDTSVTHGSLSTGHGPCLAENLRYVEPTRRSGQRPVRIGRTFDLGVIRTIGQLDFRPLMKRSESRRTANALKERSVVGFQHEYLILNIFQPIRIIVSD